MRDIADEKVEQDVPETDSRAEIGQPEAGDTEMMKGPRRRARAFRISTFGGNTGIYGLTGRCLRGK
ncbi:MULTISPECIES: hypothetical protein [unclassified Rhizobium]|uniref:hypothetical protein n=1 Tax=unclassified Rhizobium TaxID=2613769 RepID=UPI0006FBEC7B|nr:MULTISPECIES: hypothetical protein [unclassified Rhizobium]KQV34713.1 hypothetical protein ASC86_14445 [Rhizobium sp. Root1212]KRD24047.1 hypothetical protein ASE37_14440 [Rhizobium sp. Root268]